jgi:hypothetical protein
MSNASLHVLGALAPARPNAARQKRLIHPMVVCQCWLIGIYAFDVDEPAPRHLPATVLHKRAPRSRPTGWPVST